MSTLIVDLLPDLASPLLTAIRRETVFPQPSRETIQDVKCQLPIRLEVAYVVFASRSRMLDPSCFLLERM